MTGKKQWYLAFGHDVQTVTDNLTFYTSTIERNGGIKVNKLTDYQNQQMEKMLEFLRGIDLSQEEIQMLIWLAGWEESTIDTFLSIMDKVVMVVNIIDLKQYAGE